MRPRGLKCPIRAYRLRSCKCFTMTLPRGTYWVYAHYSKAGVFLGRPALRILRWPLGLLGVAAATLGLLAWTTASLSSFGVPWWRFLLALLVTGLLCWGFGGAVQILLGLPQDERRSPFFRLALGFAVAVTLVTLLVYTRMGSLFVAISIGVLGLASWVFLFRRQTPGLRAPQLADARDWMMLAVFLRVWTAGSQYVSVGESTVHSTQFWDLPFHLALVKEGLFRGLPVSQNPLLAGVDRMPYHPAFDNFATILIKSTGLPIDAGFYGVVLPLLGVAFLAALAALTGLATGSRWAPYFTIIVLGAFPALSFVLERIPSLSAYADKDLLFGFVAAPPTTMAAVAAAMSVALFAFGFGPHRRRCLVGAAVLAGATVCMKANTAVALGPAFACGLVVLAWRQRSKTLALFPAGAAVVSAAICYLPTRGKDGAKLGIDPGAYARYVRPGPNPATEFWSRATEKLGVFGDALFLAGHLVSSFFLWRIFPALCALFRRPRLSSPDNERRASAVNTYLLWLIIWVFVVSFTMVQVDVGRFSAWNISFHTVKNLTWVGVVLAGIGLYRIARRVLSRRLAKWLSLAALVVIVGTTPLTMRSVENIRQVPGRDIAVGAYEVLRQIPALTEADAVVAQHFDTEWNAWVSGVSGRPAVLERAETWRAYQPAEADRRIQLLSAFYQATTPAAARQVAADLGVSYAVVGPGDSPVVMEIGVELVRKDGWTLVRLR